MSTHFSRISGATLAVAYAVLLFFVVGMLLSPAARSETKAIEMVVSLKNAKTVVVRATPDQEAAAIAFIENGKPVLRKGQEETNGFVMVQLGDGRTGWTKSAFLASPGRAAVFEPPAAPAPPAIPDLPEAGSFKTLAAGGGEQLSVVRPEHPRNDQPQPLAEPVHGKAPTELWVIGLVGAIGMVIGLVIGGKVGAVYATKSIQERYEIIS